jgi:hypothetical protein
LAGVVDFDGAEVFLCCADAALFFGETSVADRLPACIDPTAPPLVSAFTLPLLDLVFGYAIGSPMSIVPLYFLGVGDGRSIKSAGTGNGLSFAMGILETPFGPSLDVQ